MKTEKMRTKETEWMDECEEVDDDGDIGWVADYNVERREWGFSSSFFLLFLICNDLKSARL